MAYGATGCPELYPQNYGTLTLTPVRLSRGGNRAEVVLAGSVGEEGEPSRQRDGAKGGFGHPRRTEVAPRISCPNCWYESRLVTHVVAMITRTMLVFTVHISSSVPSNWVLRAQTGLKQAC